MIVSPDELAEGTPRWLRDDLVAILGGAQVLSRAIDLVKFASDASPYRMFPKVVVFPRDEEEVRQVFAYAKQKQIPVTIRAAGSSLSGQSQGDGILLEARRYWAGWNVEDQGCWLRVRPGTVMFRANLALAAYGYRLGPDPASVSVCTVGGVIANNASGMCCGTAQNSYKTIDSLTFLLASGLRIDTADPDAERKFAASARLCRRVDGDQAGNRGRRRLGEASAAEIPHQEYDRLSHGGIPRRRHAARDFPPVARRIGGDAGVPRRGRLQYRTGRQTQDHGIPHLSGHACRSGRSRSLRRTRRGGRRTLRPCVVVRGRRKTGSSGSVAGPTGNRDGTAR